MVGINAVCDGGGCGSDSNGHYVGRGLMVGINAVHHGGGSGSDNNVFALPNSQRVVGSAYVCWTRLQT